MIFLWGKGFINIFLFIPLILAFEKQNLSIYLRIFFFFFSLRLYVSCLGKPGLLEAHEDGHSLFI